MILFEFKMLDYLKLKKKPKIRNMFKIPKVGQAHLSGPSAVFLEAYHVV